MKQLEGKELYKAALKKLEKMSDAEIKAFIVKPTGSLLGSKDLELLQAINMKLSRNNQPLVGETGSDTNEDGNMS